MLALLGRRARFAVAGESMRPTLAPGDQVVVEARLPRAGEIAVAHHPYQGGLIVIKRVGRVEPSGDRVLVGDNPAGSTDSRGYGAVAEARIIGTAVARLA